jgi:ABC-type sugar transport system ATPase subunit
MVSSELEEVLAMSDRILVFRRGKPVAAVGHEDATQKSLMMAAL